MFDLCIRNTSEVLTLDHGSAQGAVTGQLGDRILRGAIGIRSGKIAFLGPEAELPSDHVGSATQVIDAEKCFVGPGFVDAHTHAVFAGDRSDEFAMRCAGRTYEEIAAAGGGIASTVRATREASEAELVELALPRLARLLRFGITCAEVKSGYGLNVEDELKMLRAIRTLNSRQPIRLVPTLLCGHAIPPEWKRDRTGYLRLCIDEILPRVASEKLAIFCDAFIDEGALTLAEGRRLLEAAAQAGFLLRIHADQLTCTGASQLAAGLGAACVDHLEQIDEPGIESLKKSGTAAVLLPTTALFLRQKSAAPGRRLWDAGIPMALGTNLNPGSAFSENHSLALGLACLSNGLTPGEAYWAATRGAALALRVPEAGYLGLGARADLVVFGCSDYRHLPYHLGINHVRYAVVGGKAYPGDAQSVCPSASDVIQ